MLKRSWPARCATSRCWWRVRKTLDTTVSFGPTRATIVPGAAAVRPVWPMSTPLIARPGDRSPTLAGFKGASCRSTVMAVIARSPSVGMCSSPSAGPFRPCKRRFNDQAPPVLLNSVARRGEGEFANDLKDLHPRRTLGNHASWQPLSAKIRNCLPCKRGFK